MRSLVRSLFVGVVAVLTVVLLAVASAVTSALSLTAVTALIVPGTGTPDPSPTAAPRYEANALDYYVVPSNCGGTTTPCTDIDPVGVPYIAQFWPFPFAGWGGLQGAKWNVSVASGVDSLNTQYAGAPAEDSVTVFGYSQGATVASLFKRQLAATGGVPADVSFVLIGNPQRPNGGLFSRLAILGTLPILDATFGNPTPTNTSGTINTVDVALQYDGVSDFPTYPLNLLAVLNALAGFEYIHGTYLDPRGDQPATSTPYGYQPGEIQELIAAQNTPQTCAANPRTCQVHGDTIYITIPARSLPIMQPFLDLGAATGTSALIRPLVALLSPVTQVLIETGYDRSDYGQFTPARLIPVINPVTLAEDLVRASVQGVQDAIAEITGTTRAPARIPGPVTTVTVPAGTEQRAAAVAGAETPDVEPVATAEPAEPQPAEAPVVRSTKRAKLTLTTPAHQRAELVAKDDNDTGDQKTSGEPAAHEPPSGQRSTRALRERPAHQTARPGTAHTDTEPVDDTDAAA